MNDPSFMELASRIQNNPMLLQASVARMDPRGVQILAALADTAVDVSPTEMDAAREEGSVPDAVEEATGDKELTELTEPAEAKALGGRRFGEQDFRGALRAYVHGITLSGKKKEGGVGIDAASMEALGPLGIAALHGNVAMCGLKLKEWRLSIRQRP